MSTIDDLRELNAVVRSWLAEPSVWPFDTSEELAGAEEFTIWYDGELRYWNFGFGYEWASEHPDYAKHVFNLRRYGVTTHHDAINFLQLREWDIALQAIAFLYDEKHA